MHYIDEGAGPPIVFCHGNPTWSFLYRNIITRLRDSFRCIAPDYLGFGLSDRPPAYSYTVEEHAAVVGEMLDHLDLDGYVSMGQDWGGPISMAEFHQEFWPHLSSRILAPARRRVVLM